MLVTVPLSKLGILLGSFRVSTPKYVVYLALLKAITPS
nr:MAG TPA: hypothetical protein [Caudoviricetes sp.]